MGIMEHNGGTLMAMTGKGCVVIGTDMRLGDGMGTLVMNKEKVYKMDERIYVGLAGLATDSQSVVENMRFRTSLHTLREDRPLKPQTFTTMLSNYLYEKRFGPFFTEPIVAGINHDTGAAEVYAMDLIGCITTPRDFVATGVEADTVMGMCEAVWEPDMDMETLFTAASQAFLSALDQICISGWGAVFYVITPEKVLRRVVKTRCD